MNGKTLGGAAVLSQVDHRQLLGGMSDAPVVGNKIRFPADLNQVAILQLKLPARIIQDGLAVDQEADLSTRRAEMLAHDRRE